MGMNLSWVRHNKTLSARAQVVEPQTLSFITDRDMQQVQEWCQQNECGRRISFDTFKFRTRAEMSAFLLRWS